MKVKCWKKMLIATLFIFLLVITFGMGMFIFYSPAVAYAETFTEQTIDNGKFSMKVSASGRKNNALDLDKQTVTNAVGEEVEYFRFNWRDIEHLRFRFNSNIKNSTNIYRNYKFLLTNIQTDDMTATLGVKEPQTLYQGNITNNNFSQFEFLYYIDSTSDINESSTRMKGNDFGLYKFDFVYTYLEDGVEISVSIGDIYFAIMPDDIDTITPSDTRILYSISSSNKLMNVFNLYLSSDTFKYVNPIYIEWSAVGMDKTNTNYVLTQQMREENLNYANYKPLWQSLIKTHGNSFIFDSNDIEGTWNVYCTIKNTDGSEKITYTAPNLSTIKKAEQSWLWLILLIIGLVVVIGFVIVLVVLLKKRDKVW